MRPACRLAVSLLLPPLAACGLRQPLEPPPGGSMPPAPAAARRAPTTEELLLPPPIARPERVDELLRRSEVREGDRFDLPPAEIPAAGDPVEPKRENAPE